MITLYGISSSSSSFSSSPNSSSGYFSREESDGWTETGCFSEAAVVGLRSCVGEGLRFMDAVWIVSAIWRGTEEDILVVFRGVG